MCVLVELRGNGQCMHNSNFILKASGKDTADKTSVSDI